MPTEPSPEDVSAILEACRSGEEGALDRLVPLVYDELRAIAARYLRGERPGHTLQPTALVNEAFVRLLRQRDVPWQNRAHFVGCAAQAMRHILVDHARTRATTRRGGGQTRVELDEALGVSQERDVDLVSLDEALSRLASQDAEQARLVELRFFGGLSIEEAAEVLGISTATVSREWAVARAWLKREMRRSGR